MLTIRAAWVFPVTSPPIPDGCVSIDGDQIVRVGPADLDVSIDLDLGPAAIVPGFVNAHTHLELGPIPRDEAAGPEDEVAWLGRVIRSRFDRSDEEVDALIRRNLRSAIEVGTTALGDITTAGRSWDAVAAAPVWATVFAEVLGLSNARGNQTWQTASDWLAALPPTYRSSRTRPGLSPHAPYSTDGRLYRLAAASGLPLATHLGEMPEEREWLLHRSGPLRRFVEGLGAWVDAWAPVGPSPADYLDLDDAEHPPADWIVAHANILEPAEFRRLSANLIETKGLVSPGWQGSSDPGLPSGTSIDRGLKTPATQDAILQAGRGGMAKFDPQLGPRRAVAYCPRTHTRFGHPPHPFRAMLDAGVVVCLGTDSLASTPTLSILDEVRFLRRHHPDVPGATLLRMATLHGAWALRLDDRTGSLEPGKSADLAVLSMRAGASPDPHDLWLDHDAATLATVFRGAVVAGRLG